MSVWTQAADVQCVVQTNYVMHLISDYVSFPLVNTCSSCSLSSAPNVSTTTVGLEVYMYVRRKTL